MRKIVVQIKDKSGVRLERVTIGADGLLVGRAWNSGVILQDRFVDPDHLRLSLGDEGVIMVTDLASTNGTAVGGWRMHADTKPYRFGDPIRLGDTTLRIYDHAAGVAATAVRSAWFSLSERFSSFAALALLTLVAIMLSVFADWFAATKPIKIEDALLLAVSTLIFLLFWCVVFGFVGKIIRGESNFRSLWILGCLGAIGLNIATLLTLFVRFNIQNIQFGYWVSVVVFGGLGVWLWAGAFTYSTHISERFKWAWSILIVLAVWGLTESGDLLKEPHEKWTSQTRTEGATLPPAFLFRKPVSLEQYQAQTDQLFVIDLQND